MLLLSEKLVNIPIMSLQTGSEIGRTSGVIIDPRTLNIPAFYISGPQVGTNPAVLHIEDIREYGDIGFIIDDSDKIMALDGLVRLQTVIDFEFDILACQVVDKAGSKLGRVSDFSFEPDTFSIQNIYIQQSFLRSITTASNIISRKQILSVTKDKIVVDSPTIQEKISQRADQASNFVNPFRSNPQTDHMED